MEQPEQDYVEACEINPPPDSDPELTPIEALAVQAMLAEVSSMMNEEWGFTLNVAHLPAYLQPLVRQMVVAYVESTSEGEAGVTAEAVRQLLDSGKLDSPSVAHAPTASQVADLIVQVAQAARLDTEAGRDGLHVITRLIVADAMDSAVKRTLSAPQTVGSVFTRPPRA